VVGLEIQKQVGKQLISLNQVKKNCIKKFFLKKFLFELDTNSNSKILAEIDGDDSILYWVNLTTEMAFYLPHQFSG